jgi:hypothetical protein
MLRNVVLNIEDRMFFNNHPNLSSSFRMLIIGSSGSGKTSLLTTLLLEPGFIDYDCLYIFTSTKSQQEYQLLYHGYSNGLTKESIASIMLNQTEFKGVPISILCKKYADLHKQNGGISVILTDKLNDLIPPDKLDKTKKNLIVFDDCVNAKNQNILSNYYSKGRHNNCNCIYLSQSFFDLERMIRLNSNILILFKLSQRNKSDIYNSIVGTMMDRSEFYSIADNAWSQKYRYIVVDRDKKRVFTDIFNVESDSDSDY